MKPGAHSHYICLNAVEIHQKKNLNEKRKNCFSHSYQIECSIILVIIIYISANKMIFTLISLKHYSFLISYFGTDIKVV